MSRVVTADDIRACHVKQTKHITGKDFYEYREALVEFPDVTCHIRIPKGRAKVPRTTQWFVGGKPVGPAHYNGQTYAEIAAKLTEHYGQETST